MIIKRAVIDYTSTGKVDSFEIIDPGDNYQVGDKISLSLEPDSEILETVRINLIQGREVDSVSYSTYEENDIEIIQINSSQYVGVCSELHQFNDSDVVRLSGFSTNISNKIEKDLFKLNTISETYALKTPINNVAQTGSITNIGVFGDIRFPSLMTDDILRINEEKLKVLEIDNINKYLRVEREIDGTVGCSFCIVSNIPRIQKI